MKLDFKFVKACKETEVELDGVIRALGGTPQHKETIAEYNNGTISSYDIVGTITSASILNRSAVVKLDIGTDVTSIGSKAISKQNGYSSIKTLIIPNSVISSENSICYRTSTLTDIKIGSGLTSISWGAFEWCSGLTSVVLPKKIKSIGGNAFSECSGLKQIEIQSMVSSIGSTAFHNCSSLSSITCNCSTAPNVGNNVFGGLYGAYTYAGRNTYSTGKNELKVPQGATGYDSSYWADPLQNATKCGFHIEYLP